MENAPIINRVKEVVYIKLTEYNGFDSSFRDFYAHTIKSVVEYWLLFRLSTFKDVSQIPEELVDNCIIPEVLHYLTRGKFTLDLNTYYITAYKYLDVQEYAVQDITFLTEFLDNLKIKVPMAQCINSGEQSEVWTVFYYLPPHLFPTQIMYADTYLVAIANAKGILHHEMLNRQQTLDFLQNLKNMKLPTLSTQDSIAWSTEERLVALEQKVKQLCTYIEIVSTEQVLVNAVRKDT